MSRTREKVGRLSEAPVAPVAPASTDVVRVGWIVRIDASGRAWVDFPGNRGEPVAARSTLEIPVGKEGREAEDARVLLALEGGDPTLPIIVGVVRDTVRPAASAELAVGRSSLDDVHLDGRRIHLEAAEEIVLRCGKGSVTIRADGKIVVKGTNLLSRSSGPHRIKGGTVEIN